MRWLQDFNVEVGVLFKADVGVKGDAEEFYGSRRRKNSAIDVY